MLITKMEEVIIHCHQSFLVEKQAKGKLCQKQNTYFKMNYKKDNNNYKINICPKILKDNKTIKYKEILLNEFIILVKNNYLANIPIQIKTYFSLYLFNK